ncbi:hypothetical protein Aduo_010329 [Ancylostoma duodenale]
MYSAAGIVAPATRTYCTLPKRSRRDDDTFLIYGIATPPSPFNVTPISVRTTTSTLSPASQTRYMDQ